MLWNISYSIETYWKFLEQYISEGSFKWSVFILGKGFTCVPQESTLGLNDLSYGLSSSPKFTADDNSIFPIVSFVTQSTN